MKRFTALLFAAAIAICSSAIAGEKAGVTVKDIADKGYISDWMVIGKFSPGVPGGYTGMVVSRKADLTKTDFLSDRGGEAALEPEIGMTHERDKKQMSWTELKTANGLIDLGDIIPKTNESTMYAATYIYSDQPSALYLEIESLTGVAVYVNHELAVRSPSGALGSVGVEKIQVPLKAGSNLLLIKFGGLRYTRAADTLQLPLEEVLSYVRDVNQILAGGSGLCISVKAGPMQQIGSTPIYTQANLIHSGYFHGKADKPEMEFGIIVANGSDSPVDGVTVKVECPSLRSDASASTRLEPKSNKRLLLSLAVKPNTAGKTFDAKITASAMGQSFSVPAKLNVAKQLPNRNQAIYYITGFHADPVWIENQRDYAVALIGSSRQNTLLAMSDPHYGVYMSEIDSLKPFFDIYPEFRQPLLDMIKEDRVGTGGSYNQPVEKLISGEALVRNILYGKMFHEKVLGSNPRVFMVWDVFGHVPQLSQIVAKTDSDGTMWSKSIWGFPPLFQHMALDGTTVLHKRGAYGSWSRDLSTLISNVYDSFQEYKSYGLDYDARLDANDFKPPTAWLAGESGYLRSLLPSIDVTGTGGNKFFANAKAEIDSGQAKIPITSRDMGYYHQGTALTRESLKTGNRVAENNIITAEKYGTIAAMFGATYPDKALDKAWRQLLFGQHHDALTGTINDMSYLDLMAGYREALDLSTGAIDKSLGHIGKLIDTEPPAGMPSGAVPLAVFNQLNWDRTDVAHVSIDFGAAPVRAFNIEDGTGALVPFDIEKLTKDSDGRITAADVLFIAEKAPQMGYTLYYAVPTDSMPGDAECSDSDAATIENDYYKLEADAKRGGGISSLYDKINKKEVVNLEAGVGNDIAALKENPGRHEPPWELFTTGKKAFASDNQAKISAKTCAVSSRLLITGKTGDTDTVREIILYKNLPRIEFVTHLVDYKDMDDLFVVTFPAKVDNAVPVFDDRYGVITRKKSKGKLDFRTWQFNNYSDHAAYAAYQWLDQSNSGIVEFKDADRETTASFALGMMAIVTDHSDAAKQACDTLISSFVKKGITSTPWYDDGDAPRLKTLPRSDTTMPTDMNFDLSFGTSFRVSLNSGMNNLFTQKVFAALDPKTVLDFENRVRNEGYAYLLVFDPTAPKDWPQLPLLIIKGANDTELANAVGALAADFDSDAVITLEDIANATASDQKVENYGVALLNQGEVLNSVENDGTMTMALMHTASFFRRLPFQLIPEHRTASFPYALLPHAGNWRDAALYRSGYEYNNPLLARQLTAHDGALPASGMSFLTTHANNLVLTAMKPRGNPTASFSYIQSDPRNALTLRYFEAEGKPAQARLEFFAGIRKAFWSNLLEEKDFGRVNVTTGVLEDTVKPFEIKTYELTPQTIPAQQTPEQLGATAEPYQPVYSRYWMHNDGAAPLGYMPLTIGVRGDIQTKIHINQGGVTINEFEVFLTNDFTDRKLEGTARIIVPADWRAVPDTFDYVLKPGENYSKRIVLAFLGEGRDGIIKVQTDIDGQTIQDVLEVGTHKLDVSAKLSGDTVSVLVKNDNNQPIEAELYLMTPFETWGASRVGGYSTADISPLVMGVTVPQRQEKTYEFKVKTERDDVPAAWWGVVKCAYNGKVIYVPVDGTNAVPTQTSSAKE